MASLGELYWNLRLLDFTDADIKRANEKLRSLGSDVQIDGKKLKDSIDSSLPKFLKIEIEGKATQEGLQKAVEGKVIKVEVLPLLTRLRSEIKAATSQTPVEIDIAPNAASLRRAVENACLKQGFMLTINTINDEFTKKIKQKLNGDTYQVKISCDPTVMVRSVQAALMSIQSRSFGLMVSRDILHRSINDALLGHQFPIQIKVLRDQARAAVQTALQGAANVTGADAQKAQRLATAELRAAQAELARLKAAHLSAADAASMHARASLNLGGAMGSNIRIAGELGSAMASLYSIHAAKEFLAQVIEIGGELEHQKIALDTIYGDPGKTQTLFSQIKSLARESPFGVMDLTKNIKQLSAYGVAYNEVFDTAKRLADISAATSVDINRLILAFGKTKNRTFLDGLEAKQFAYANIPIYDALSKKLTELEGKFVSVKDVMGRIKKREIGFDMVKEILWDMTDEGGKFYNMQEKLAGSVKTSWKLVRDNIELMFGEIAEGKVGSALKWLAELLQGMTRNWQTLGVVVGATAGAFAISRLAVAAHSVVLERNTSAAIKKLASQRMIIAANAGAAISYRRLTTDELMNVNASRGLRKIEGLRILTRTQLTTKEVQAMMAAKALTREELLKLVALKKVSVATAEKVLITKDSTAADAAATRMAIADAAATKKRTVVMAQFRASLTSVGMALKGLFLNPWTAMMAGIMAVTHLIMKQSEETRKAKEIGDNLFTKATEGADNLKKKLEQIKPSQDLSELELKQGIESMEEALKDYSPTPIKDINEALYTQEGLLRPIAERYDELKKKVEELKAAFDEIENKNISSAVQNAIDDTNTGWFGLFNDDVNTNASDYAESLKKQDAAIRKFLTNSSKYAREAVREALEGNADYAARVTGMTMQQQFTELVKNWDKYKNSFAPESRVSITVASADDENSIKVKENLSRLQKDMWAFWQSIRTDAAQHGITAVENATDEVKEAYAISIKEWIQGLEVPDDVKQMMYNYYSSLLRFDFEVFNAQEMISDALDKGLEEQVGKAIYKKVKNGLKLTEQEQNQLTEAFYAVYFDLYKKVPDIQKEALNNAIASPDKDGVPTFDSAKIARIVAKLNIRADWSEWQREIDDATGNLSPIQTWIKGAADHKSFVEATKEGYKTAKSTIDALKPLMLKAGLSVNVDNLQAIPLVSTEFANASASAQKMIMDWNESVEIIKAAQKASNELGFDLESESKKGGKAGGGKGSKKDAVAESIKQRFKDLKDAWNEYQKWAKTEGNEAAAKRIADSGLFSTLPADRIPKTVKQYRELVAELEKELQSAGIKGHSQRESLLNELLKQLLDIDKTVVDEQLRLALEKVSRETERQLADWDLFDKIRKSTGDENLAVAVAFGADADVNTDYVSMVKGQFAAVADQFESTEGLTFDMIDDISQLADAPEEVRKAWEKAYGLIEKYRDKERDDIAGMLEQYRSTQEEIVALTTEAEKKKREIRENKDLSPVVKEQLIEKIDSELNYRIFQKSGQYLKFFNAILSMTGSEAEDVGRKIKKALDDQLKAGTISAKDYCDEMEKIDAQLDKIRQKQAGFGGVGSFAKGGLQQMFQDRFDKAQSDYNAATQDYENAKGQFDFFSKEGNEAGMQQAQSAMDAASAMQQGAQGAMQGAQGAMQAMQVIDTIVHGINDTVQGIKGAFDLIAEMADSYGVDTSADTDWGAASAFLGAFSEASQYATDAWDSLKSGNIGGVIQGVVGSITSWFTAFNEWHDAKLDRQIEKSRQIVQQIQNAYDAIERRMENFLGNRRNTDIFDLGAARSELAGLDADIDAATRRLDELRGRKGDGLKTGAIATAAGAALGPLGVGLGMAIGSIAGSIQELVNRSKIKKTEKELNRLYEQRAKLAARIAAYEEGGALGLQRQMMTEQLAELEKQRDAEASKKKKDQAALDDYDAQIDEMKVKIRDFALEMARDVYGIDLSGWAEQIGDALVDAFAAGEDAAEAFDKTVGDIMRSVVSKMISADILAPMFKDLEEYLFGTDGQGGAYGRDFLLDADEAAHMGELLMGIKTDGVERAKELYDRINSLLGGMLDDTESASSGLSAGIQGITEETADILASYVNAIRAYCLEHNLDFKQLMQDHLPKLSLIAEAQLSQLSSIAENTRRNMIAAEAILSAVENIYNTLNKATTSTSWGFYVR